MSVWADELVEMRLGDCRAELPTLASQSVDAIVTDPPAGIEFMGKAWDTFRDQPPTPSGTQTESWGEFQSPYARGATPRYQASRRERDSFIVYMQGIFCECLRVLKPGGHALVWAIPRTSHWTATALEDAGFEIRDVVTHHFGSGFPKSLDVSKAIDRAAGAEREVVGYDAERARPNRLGQVMGERPYDRSDNGATLTAPATPEAAQWAGWGTALKPASEHWILARRPLEAGSVAAQVLATGTGALNIEATRIATTSRPLLEGTALDTPGKNVYGSDGPGGGSRAVGETSVGRWPANLVLSHGAGCRLVGTEVVIADGHYSGGKGSREAGVTDLTSLRSGTGEDRQVGAELVEAWECEPGCPVSELDQQSGLLTSGANPTTRGSDKFRDTYGDFAGQRVESPQRGLDRGYASRFFYTAKASRSERNQGLWGLQEEPVLWSSGEQSPGTFQSPNTRRQAQNHHPTVKPLELMRWLCRLITPPGGLVLDPFMGSGSTLVAAKLEGFRALGIEREGAYFEIARRRLTWAVHEPGLPLE